MGIGHTAPNNPVCFHKLLLIPSLLIYILASAPLIKADSYRIKDIARIGGLNYHHLTGYGLVVGLPNTGDSSTVLTSTMLNNMFTRLGLTPPPNDIRKLKTRNIALVAITAKLPPFALSGDSIDVEVASMGDAKSIAGGILLHSILRGPDGKIYASAQGKIAKPPPTLDRRTKKQVTGIVPGGGTVARNIASPALQRSKVVWELYNPDLATAQEIAAAISQRFGPIARVLSPSQVEVDLSGASDPVSLLAQIGKLPVKRDAKAAILYDQTSGTVVLGAQVRLRPIVLSHRGFTIQINSSGTDLKTLVDSLYKSGASPEDIGAVLKALHETGALSGEFIIK